MQLSANSKKLIIAIAALTILGVIVSSPESPEEPPKESIATASGQSSQHDFVLDPTTIKSLTNLTQNVQLKELNITQQYRGYIQGVGYSSYLILAEQGQKIRFQLDAPNTIEMLLYGANIVPINNNMEYTIPESGLYDLRVLYKPSVEAEQAKKATEPEAYKIAFTLTGVTSQEASAAEITNPSSSSADKGTPAEKKPTL